MSAGDDIADGGEWSPAERALLDAAIDFYGAAETVIDLGGERPPQLRYDVNGLQAVREAMTALEERIRAAHEDGVTPARIARITRLEHEIVELIVSGRKGAIEGAAES